VASIDKPTDRSDGRQTPTTPSISLPKGGGAIRGIGEKFAANPVTGTGTMSIPLATSPSRSGFGPQLALSYDSGSGNGPFGFGWSLSLPAITRKTDKGLPRYRDAEESDVFVLSGAEDLVPVPARRLLVSGSTPLSFLRIEGVHCRPVLAGRRQSACPDVVGSTRSSTVAPWWVSFKLLCSRGPDQPLRRR
jgi:Salmonella virulence plasmid 65kDa B protein